jgi:hypothetical protein
MGRMDYPSLLAGSSTPTHPHCHSIYGPAGGVSPLTLDWVNPERPWPHLDALSAATAAAGKLLHPRLPVYPPFLPMLAIQPSAVSGRESSHATVCAAQEAECWLNFSTGRSSAGAAALAASDSQGFLRASDWVAGKPIQTPEGTDGELPATSAQASDAAAGTPTTPAAQGRPDGLHSASVLPKLRKGRAWRVAVGPNGALEVASLTDPSTAVVRLGRHGGADAGTCLCVAAGVHACAVQQASMDQGLRALPHQLPAMACRILDAVLVDGRPLDVSEVRRRSGAQVV